MITTLRDKKEISKKLKEKAINEGFTIAGIAKIPGSSRLKLRSNALVLKFNRELPVIEAIPDIVKPSVIALSFNFLLISFLFSMLLIISLLCVLFFF